MRTLKTLGGLLVLALSIAGCGAPGQDAAPLPEAPVTSGEQSKADGLVGAPSSLWACETRCRCQDFGVIVQDITFYTCRGDERTAEADDNSACNNHCLKKLGLYGNAIRSYTDCDADGRDQYCR